MAFNKDDKNDAPRRRGGAGMRKRKKVCVFCGVVKKTEGDTTVVEAKETISYKDTAKLKRYVSERGKILPRRVTGCCAKHQRAITSAVKRARHVALMPYVQD